MSTENEILNKLLKEYDIESEVEFNEFNLAEKIQNNSFILMKYNHKLIEEKSILEKLKDILEKKVGERYHYYRFNFDEELTKSEIEKYYLPKDDELKKLKKLINEQKIRVDFFETATKAIESQKWNMKNFIESLKNGV